MKDFDRLSYPRLDLPRYQHVAIFRAVEQVLRTFYDWPLMLPAEGHSPSGGAQHLAVFERRADGSLAETNLGAVAFVPLLGEQAWPPEGR